MQLEVIVTDLVSVEAVERVAGGRLHGDVHDARLANVGIISVSTRDWSDVSLPPDYTGRELALACTLVAEIARLRIQRVRSAEAQDRFRDLAHTDPLTGLPNRRAWELQFAAKLEHARSAGGSLWLAIVDLDRFKQVNDTGGLTAGDDVLRRAAQALAGGLRRGDVIARIGGDEFCVLLSAVDETIAARVFERLLAAVATAEMLEGSRGLTVSIGYTSGLPDGTAAAELFEAAERALRQAKTAGGNRACRA